MRIKSLDVSGFKSFANRARLQFGDGITGVVGPNGCGKSNVVDAIRWVLGEMSAKHLRGRGMQDVIFAGAQNKAAQNMAEVTLTFTNDGDAPGPFADASEIAVTRRLFRDGTSEYLLNKQTVRLRDIVDLFLGTGVGTRAYSIIEQGRIGFVVSARPEERRQLIEEVAGISKFKSRKKAAERRMAATEQNLARVGDVLGELDRQLTGLREQAEQARAFRSRKAALYGLELHRATYQWLTLRLSLAFAERRIGEVSAALAHIEEGLGAAEAISEEQQGALQEQERAVGELRQASMAATARFVATERDLSHWQEQAGQLATQAEQAAQTSEQLALRAAQAAQEADTQRAAAEAAGAAQQASESALVDLNAQHGEASAKVAALDQQLATLRREALAKVQAVAEQRGRLASLNAQLEAADEQEKRLQQESLALSEQGQLAEQAVRAAGSALAEATSAQQQAQSELEGRLAERRAQQEACQASAAAAREQADALAQQQHRLASLSEVVRRLDGYADGVRTLLGAEAIARDQQGKPHGERQRPAAAAEQPSRLKGLLGVVAEVLDVPPAHEQAIEAVLGERLQYVRVAEREDAHAAMAKLTAGKLGRSGFVPAGLTVAPPLPETVALAGDGIIGLASDLVRAQPSANELCRALLGRVVLVESLAVAEAQARENAGLACTWVTPDGELCDGQGILLGGSAGGAGLLANRREMRQLTATVAAGEAALAAARESQEEAEAALRHLNQACDQAKAARHALDLEVLGKTKGLEASKAEHERLGRAVRQLSDRVAEAAGKKERASTALKAAMAAAESLSGQSDEERDKLAQAEQTRSEAAAAQLRAQNELTEQRVIQAAHQERAKAAAAAAARLDLELTSLERQREQAAERSAASSTQAAALRGQIEGGGASMAARASERDQALAAQATAEQALEAARAAHEAREQQLRHGRRDQAELRAELAEHQLRAQKCSLDQAALCAQIAERHDVDLLEELAEFHDAPPPTKAAAREEQRLVRELKAMGTINLTAIDECAALEARTSFLRAQQKDLEQALKTLRAAVSRIDEDSKERFSQAFAAVNEMFQKMYPRLFGGGSAKLVLIEGDEQAEAGVDMVAMPPGKKLQNVSLLSGGEKALTATALVFAIFLIKPSPFCILDEVDAPLDEANVGRFNETLREMSKLSQFIVITHNKQTMLQMDRLFGITMEDAGLSKVVAVDLDDQRPGSQAA